MVDKTKRIGVLAKAIAAFEHSPRTFHDYADLLAAAQRVCRTTDGFMWHQVEEAIRAGLALPPQEMPDGLN